MTLVPRLWMLALLLALSGQALLAQAVTNPGTKGPPLTLADAEARALSKHPRLNAETLRAQASANRTRWLPKSASPW